MAPTQLPPREQQLFKRILKCYEHKQYKNGLKAAKQILSQAEFAEHGETLAMKGLTLNCMDRKEEALELIKRGLRNHLTSHVCWHVYGLYYRSAKNHAEAIKCYRNALKFDKNNTQILRDLSIMLIQTRDLEGFKETRAQLLQVKNGQRASWIGLAIACHLLKQYDQAIKVLDTYDAVQDSEKSNIAPYEKSELALYRAQMMVDSGNSEQALKHLSDSDNFISDRKALKEMKAEQLLKVGKTEEAKAIYGGLLMENVEDFRYYEQLFACLEAEGLSGDDLIAKKMAVFDAIRESNPRAQAPQILPLKLLTGSEFKKRLDAYLRPGLSKGVTPLFRIVRWIYDDQDKLSVLTELLDQYLTTLDKSSKFHTDDEKNEPPSTLVWTKLFHAQHLDRLHKHADALKVINDAIDHTPTVLELYMIKAKIYRHGGDYASAAHWLNYARELDTADRFINSKCVKYLLRNVETKKAEEIVSLFTRQEAADPIGQLSEMQCMWFETEAARAFEKKGDFGMALKKLHSIDNHFTTIIEEQFDFHSYCMRKMTLRSYVRLLRLEDELQGHRFFHRAALIAVRIYVGLFDNPFGAKEKEDEEALLAGLSPAERKKRKRKLQKAKLKAAAAEEAEAAAKAQAAKKPEDPKKAPAKKDDDPKGEKYLKTETPLENALLFLKPLLQFSPHLLEAHIAAFEVYSRKGKMLLMLKAVKRAVAIAPSDPSTHKILMKFMIKLAGAKDIHPVVQQVVDIEIEKIVKKQSAEECNALFLKSNASSFQHVMVGAEMMVALKADSKGKAVKLIVDSAIPNINVATDLQACIAARDALDSVFSADDATKEKFMAKFKETFPLATCFNPTAAAAAEEESK